MAQVNSCCCGCSLETGSILISIWEMFLSLLTIGLGIYVLEQKGIEEEDVLKIMMIIAICVGAISGLFAILLLIGTLKKIPSMLKAWTIYMTFWVTVSLAGTVLSLIHGRSGNAVSLLITVPRIYFIVVVRILHVEMTTPGVVVSMPACPPSEGYDKFENNIA